MRRRSIAAIAFLSAILLTAVAGNAAGSTTTGGKPDGGSEQDGGAEDSYAQMVEALGPAAYRNQLDLMSFKTWMVDRGLLAEPGYAQSINDANARRTTLLWEHLPAPGDVFREQIETEAKARSIAIEFVPVSYSQDEVQRASEILMDPKTASAIGSAIYYVEGPTPESPALTVVGKFGKLDPRELGNRLQSLVDIRIPVVLREGEPLIPFATRGKDYAPFNAGGMMEGGVGPNPGADCSSGFAIRLGTQPYTSTARHCTAGTYYAFEDYGSIYGSRIATDNQTGAVLLSRAGFFWMFDGAWNNAAGYHKTVKGLWDVSLGDQMCSSGGATGVHWWLGRD